MGSLNGLRNTLRGRSNRAMLIQNPDPDLPQLRRHRGHRYGRTNGTRRTVNDAEGRLVLEVDLGANPVGEVENALGPVVDEVRAVAPTVLLL